MRIGFNCRSILLNTRTGIGRYSYHLLDNLGKIDQGNTYLLYARKKLFDRKRHLPSFPYANFKEVSDVLNFGARRCLKNADVYHVPSPDLVKPMPGTKLVVTVHDLIYKTHPQSHTTPTIEATARQMATIVQFADKIICISENTRRDLHRFFDLPAEKSCVIYNGVDHKTFYSLSQEERAAARGRLSVLGIRKPFILFVGTIEPRKNLNGLLKSFALLKSRKMFDGQVVVVGMKGWMMETVMPVVKVLGLQDDVVFTGFISDGQLRELYNLAEVFVFPSFYEGFGFPIVEAFCCGVPIVTSASSSCREIAGDAALTVDTQNSEALAQGITQVLEDEKLKAKMCEDGLIRSRQFSFLNTAKETLAIYEEIK